jgi:hypothetical protein
VSVFSPPLDEVIQASIPLAQEEKKVVSYTPSKVFDVDARHEWEGEYLLEEPLNA